MSRALADRRAGNPAIPGQGLIVGIGITLTVVYVGALMYLMPRSSYDTWGALIVGPVMFVVTIPLLVRQARREGDAWVFWLLLAALVLKLFGALLRAYVVSDVYGGEGDSLLYHSEGARIAAGFWDGNFDTGLDSLSDTDFIYFFTGLIYAVTGPTFLGGFLVYSWLGFLGLFFFYRAFTIAVPDGRRTLVRAAPVLPAVAGLLAVRDRQGGVDGVRARDRRVRGRPGDVRDTRARHPGGRHRALVLLAGPAARGGPGGGRPRRRVRRGARAPQGVRAPPEGGRDRRRRPGRGVHDPAGETVPVRRRGSSPSADWARPSRRPANAPARGDRSSIP